MKSLPEIVEIRKYLERMKHSKQTIRSYIYAISHFLYSNPDAENYKYKEVLFYIIEKVKDYKNTDTKNSLLSAVKKYYDYLIDVGKRNDHPCRSLILKRRINRDIIHQDLFLSEELEMLMTKEWRFKASVLKNQVLISLLIYQGLTAGELSNLKVHHVDLADGSVYVKGSRKIAKRHLEITSKQYRILEKYIYEARPASKRVEKDILIVGQLGTPITVDDINYIVSTFKPLFPDRNLNPRTIRQSVISNWLNEKHIPLEQVQLMAGHRWISATERYRYTPVAEQRELINKFHPLK